MYAALEDLGIKSKHIPEGYLEDVLGEALYESPKKLSEALKIMRDMKNEGHLDPDLYELFIKSGVYMDYAKEYIDKNQIDEINPEEFL